MVPFVISLPWKVTDSGTGAAKLSRQSSRTPASYGDDQHGIRGKIKSGAPDFEFHDTMAVVRKSIGQNIDAKVD